MIDRDTFEKILSRITPKFFYSSENGKFSGLNYFTRMTVEQYEQIYRFLPKSRRPWMRCFHNTDLPVLKMVRNMPGVLLHGFRRVGDFDMSVEGVFLPVEFSDLFKARIAAAAEHSNDSYMPDEWDEGYLLHYEDDGELISTVHVQNYNAYIAEMDEWSAGTDGDRNAYRLYWHTHQHTVPIINEDTPRYIRAWWD